MALSAAEGLVAEQGLPALTARSVARAIGYSPGTLYNVFKDLDDLVIHLNGRTIDALDRALAQATPTGDPRRDLGQLLELYLQFVRDHHNLWSVLFDYRAAADWSVPQWYLEKVGKLLGRIEAALAPLFAAGDRESAASAARVLWASLHGICSLSESNKLRVITDRSAREMAEFLVANLIAGLERQRAG